MSTELRRDLESKCADMDVPLMGIADASAWDEPPFHPFVPPEARPRSIVPLARSVVVIGIPLPMPAIDSAPSIWYAETYRTVNMLLDSACYRLSVFLEERGHPSAYIPRDGYAGIEALKREPAAFFSHRHAAVLAGMGAFGVNNSVLTPRFGPRVRFTSLITGAELPADAPLEEDLCIDCGLCARKCPAAAIDERGYPEGRTDAQACIAYTEGLSRKGISPCGMCVRVCPVGEDRDLWRNKDVSTYDQEGPRSQWGHIRRHGVR